MLPASLAVAVVAIRIAARRSAIWPKAHPLSGGSVHRLSGGRLRQPARPVQLDCRPDSSGFHQLVGPAGVHHVSVTRVPTVVRPATATSGTMLAIVPTGARSPTAAQSRVSPTSCNLFRVLASDPRVLERTRLMAPPPTGV